MASRSSSKDSDMAKQTLFAGGLIVFVFLIAGGLAIYQQNPVNTADTPKDSFQVDHLLLKVALKEGEISAKELRITNHDIAARSFQLVSSGLAGLLTVDESEFSLLPGQTKVLTLSFSSSLAEQTVEQETGTYVGSLDIFSGADKKHVPLILEIESSEVFFDTNLNSLAVDRQVKAGSNLVMEVRLFNLQSVKAETVDLNYLVMDTQGSTIVSEQENVVVQTQASFFKTVPIPLGLAPGNYVFSTHTKMGSSVGTSTYVFEVLAGPPSPTPIKLFSSCSSDPVCFTLVIAIVVLLVSLLVFFYVYFGSLVLKKTKPKAPPVPSGEDPHRSWIEGWFHEIKELSHQRAVDQRARALQDKKLSLISRKERLREAKERQQLRNMHRKLLIQEREKRRKELLKIKELKRKERAKRPSLWKIWSEKRQKRLELRQKQRAKRRQEIARIKTQKQQEREQRRKEQEKLRLAAIKAAQKEKDRRRKEKLKIIEERKKEKEQQRREKEKERIRLLEQRQKEKEIALQLKQQQAQARLQEKEQRRKDQGPGFFEQWSKNREKRRKEKLKIIEERKKEKEQQRREKEKERIKLLEQKQQEKELAQQLKQESDNIPSIDIPLEHVEHHVERQNHKHARKHFNKLLSNYHDLSKKEKQVVYGKIKSISQKIIDFEKKIVSSEPAPKHKTSLFSSLQNSLEQHKKKREEKRKERLAFREQIAKERQKAREEKVKLKELQSKQLEKEKIKQEKEKARILREEQRLLKQQAKEKQLTEEKDTKKENISQKAQHIVDLEEQEQKLVQEAQDLQSRIREQQIALGKLNSERQSQKVDPTSLERQKASLLDQKKRIDADIKEKERKQKAELQSISKELRHYSRSPEQEMKIKRKELEKEMARELKSVPAKERADVKRWKQLEIKAQLSLHKSEFLENRDREKQALKQKEQQLRMLQETARLERQRLRSDIVSQLSALSHKLKEGNTQEKKRAADLKKATTTLEKDIKAYDKLPSKQDELSLELQQALSELTHLIGPLKSRFLLSKVRKQRSSASPVESKAPSRNTKGMSKALVKYYRSYDSGIAALHRQDHLGAKRAYLTARKRYVKLTYEERKEVFEDLQKFYTKLS